MNFKEISGKNVTYDDINSDKKKQSSTLSKLMKRTNLGKTVRKITRWKLWRLVYAFWYLPKYVTYAKILIHVRDYVRWFYGNCRSLISYSYPSRFDNRILNFPFLIYVSI